MEVMRFIDYLIEQEEKVNICESLESSAALTGHFNPYIIIYAMTVVNRDSAEVKAISVALKAAGLCERYVLEPEELHDTINIMDFGSERQPVNKNFVFVNFHKQHDLSAIFCRKPPVWVVGCTPLLAGGGYKSTERLKKIGDFQQISGIALP